MNTRRLSQVVMIFFLTMTTIFLLGPVAEAAVSAKYQTVRGNRVVFLVEVASPAPTHLIVSHTSSPANRLVSTSPSANKINSAAGEAKWLLKNVKPGVYPFSLSFSQAVNKSDLSLTVNHRTPGSGKASQIRIRP